MAFFSIWRTLFVKNTIFGWILIVSLVPFFIITYLAIAVTTNALKKEITNNLSFIANQKATDIERYLIGHKKDVALLANDPIISKATELMISPSFNPSIPYFQKTVNNLHRYLSNFLSRYQLTDILIIGPTGKIIFSIKQPEVVKTHVNLLLEQSELRKTIENAKTLLEPTLSDFTTTSNHVRPQLYIASPIVGKGQKLHGVLVLQMDNKNIEKIVQDVNGLGNTGETIVGSYDSSHNTIIPQANLRHATIHEFNQIVLPPSLIAAFKKASIGEKGVGLLTDYRNQQIFAAWRYLPSMRWAMLVKFDGDEAFQSLYHFKNTIYFIGGIIFFLALLLAYSVAYKLKASEDALKHLLAEVEEAQKAAQEANLAKSAFLANMSHELRTPLNAISGYSEMLIEDAEDQRLTGFIEDLQKINGAGKHLLNLINDILDISKIEAGRMEVYLEQTDLNALLEDIAALVIPLVQRKNNTFKLNYPPSIGSMQTDITKLRQCLLNLISNASKFTENGAVTLAAESIYINEEEYIRFTCSDTGIGMTEDQLSRMFQAFTQADISTTRKFGGTGLGLYLTQRFTNMLHGHIHVTSQINVGSTFIMELPRFIPQEKALEENLLLTNNKNTLLSSVLIIDDDKGFHKILEDNLGNIFHFLHAYTGEEGLELTKTYHPNAILLDVVMPGMDGWSVLKNLRTDSALASIPIIMASMTGDQDLGYTLGVSDFLIKPVDPHLLMEKLTHHIEEKTLDVLIVEDDQTTRKMLAKMLEKAGIPTREAANGKVALEEIEQQKPSAILLDLMIPLIDGFNVLEVLRNDKRWSGIPVIVITAKDLSEKERMRLSDAFTTIMSKGGYRRKDLIQTLHTQIEKSLQKNKA